ncbi:MAG: hypothetical protein ACP5XB_26385, partial [Isosphaeraceae bacterium]
AAYLTALSPPLVYYSREARMYAWLVMMTCLSWGLLFCLLQMRNAKCQMPNAKCGLHNLESGMRSGERSRSNLRLVAYGASLTALMYSHPLGLLMAGTLALGSCCFARHFLISHSAFRIPHSTFLGGWTHWLAAHLVPLILAAPWLGHYFDHAPEFVSGRLPIRFLLGTPIGFLGGNSWVLLGLLGLIGFGLVRRPREPEPASWAGPVCLLLWLTLPPTLLYVYSWIGSPVFGPSRYTLFVAPAFLILVAQGLALLPILARLALAIGLTLLTASALGPLVYAPDLKADWRDLGNDIRQQIQIHPSWKFRIIVKSSDPARNVEVQTARYYMPRECQVVAWDEFREGRRPDRLESITYVAMTVKARALPPRPDDPTWKLNGRYPGLVVYRLGQPVPAPRPTGPGPAMPAGSGRD